MERRGSSPRRGGGWGGDGKSGGRDCMLNFGVGCGAILGEGCGCERLGRGIEATGLASLVGVNTSYTFHFLFNIINRCLYTFLTIFLFYYIMYTLPNSYMNVTLLYIVTICS